jgi:carbamoyltransferase
LSLWHRYLDQPRTSPERAGTWKPLVKSHAKGTAQGTSAGTDGASADVPYADGMSGGFLGPRPGERETAAWAERHCYKARRCGPAELADAVAALLAAEKVVGLCQGRMEFGPRALGGRSIIGDARSPKMQSVMNLKIKFRESFRPFAPAVLREHVHEWFDLDGESPYMLLVADVRSSRRLATPDAAKDLWGIEKLHVPRSMIPAVTHVDYSARIQTVRRDTNPVYYDIIHAFYRLTACPVIVNTSFNVRGEPIVCTPEDAFRCFMGTELDMLAIGNCILRKHEQLPALRLDYKNAFAPD